MELNQFVSELQQSISVFTPEVVLVSTFIVALLADVIFKKAKNIAGIIALIGFFVTAIFMYGQECGHQQQAFSNMIAIDPFAQFFKYLILITSFFIVLMSFFYNELYEEGRTQGEYYSLIVGMTFGMFLLVGANNLLMIYLAIEVMSISSYILAGYTKEIKRASEASLKYVIFGAVSSGIMIYGMSILFGLTGSLDLVGINAYLQVNEVSHLAVLLSGLMIIAGIGYKISAVPFHFWTPDVYEGAPITITAYLSVASKAAGFALLIRFLKTAFISDASSDSEIWFMLTTIDWQFIIAILAVLTMTIGNLVAIWQNNLKRLLAYSSIAHAGYLLMGVVVMDDIGVAAVMIYFLMYLFMNLGAFLVVMLLANKIGSEDIEDYAGLGYKAPVLGVAMVIFLISLTGLPPTAGFIGKLYIFTAVLNAGNEWIWLAVVGVLNSVVSLFYYVKIIRDMYIKGVEKENEKSYEFHPLAVALVVILAIPTLIFGLYFGPIIDWANNSVGIFLGN